MRLFCFDSFDFTTPAFSDEFGNGMALQPDGKVVIVGGTFTDFILARCNVDGTLDTGFDADGKVTTDMVGNEQEEALGVAIQPDGKIVVVGCTGTSGPGGLSNFALASCNGDGKIAVAGRSSSQANSDFALARYNASGTLDTGFANAGKLTIDFFGFTDIAESVGVQPDGKNRVRRPGARQRRRLRARPHQPLNSVGRIVGNSTMISFLHQPLQQSDHRHRSAIVSGPALS